MFRTKNAKYYALRRKKYRAQIKALEKRTSWPNRKAFKKKQRLTDKFNQATQDWYDIVFPNLLGLDLTGTGVSGAEVRAAIAAKSVDKNEYTDEQWAKSGLRVMEDNHIDVTWYRSFVFCDNGDVDRRTFTVRNGEIDIPPWISEEDRERILEEFTESKNAK